MNNRETLCTRCAHREVCSFKDEFLRVMEAVNEVTVGHPSKNDHTGSFIRLQDIKWIKPVELVCVHYVSNIPAFKEVIVHDH